MPDERGPDPELGGADWLFQQLSGGRHAHRAPEDGDAESAQDAEPGGEPDAGAESAPSATDAESPAAPAVAPAEGAPAPAVAAGPAAEAEPVVADGPDPVAGEQAGSWSLFGADTAAGTAETEASAEPEPEAFAEPEVFAAPAEPEPSAAELPDEAEEPPAPAFVWGLRAGDDPERFAAHAEPEPAEPPADAADADAADLAGAAPAAFTPPVEPVAAAAAFTPPVLPAEPVLPAPPAAAAEPPRPETGELPVFGAAFVPPPLYPSPTEPSDQAAEPAAPLETDLFIDTAAAAPAVSGFDFPPVAPISAADALAQFPDDPAAGAVEGLTTATAPAAEASGSDLPPRAPVDTRMLWWIGGAVVLVAVLVGLFFLGAQLAGGGAAPAAAPTSKAASTSAPPATPTMTPGPTAAAAPGVHDWDALAGGECIDPFTTPWAETFTVVDCASPHAAQLVYRGTFGGDAATPFPGEDALAAQINALCSARGIVDVNAASGYPDLQLQGSYPVTEEQWQGTARYYYCFVNRSGGEPITASVAGAGPQG